MNRSIGRRDCLFVLKGKGLGLKQLTEEDIDVRISATGGDQPAAPVNKKGGGKR